MSHLTWLWQGVRSPCIEEVITVEISEMARPKLFGEAAEDWLRSKLMPKQPGAFDVVVRTCGLLQQDMMQAILEAKPSDLHARISTGLDLAFWRTLSVPSKSRRRTLTTGLRTKESLMPWSSHCPRMLQRCYRSDPCNGPREVARATLLATLEEAPAVVHAEIPEEVNAKENRQVSASLHYGLAGKWGSCSETREILTTKKRTWIPSQLLSSLIR